MDRRKLSVAAGILLLAASMIGGWYLSTLGTTPPEQDNPTPLIDVPVVEAMPGDVPVQIHFTGRVIPKEQIDIYAEVTGVLEESPTPFKTGNHFDKGDTLVSINDDEQAQQLQAQKYKFAALLSQILPDINIDYSDHYEAWNNYLQQFDASAPLSPLPDVNSQQFELYLNGQDVYSTYHSIKQQEVRLNKFVLQAPYEGTLTESLVDPGALVQPNQRLGEFTKPSPLEIEASIDADHIAYVNEGDRVQLRITGPDPQQLTAQIDRINDKITPGTQTITVFMTVRAPSLKPGMYIEGYINGQTFPNAVKINSDALVRDSEIFVVEDSVATMRRIDILSQVGDSVVIGKVPPGTPIIDEFHEPVFEGTQVAPIPSN